MDMITEHEIRGGSDEDGVVESPRTRRAAGAGVATDVAYRETVGRRTHSRMNSDSATSLALGRLLRPW